MEFNLPEEVKIIADKLDKAGCSAYLVGGCVRDLLLGREPKDWDITTDAKPEEIQKLFPESVYENKFGTVGVKTDSADERLKLVEVTTFRLEGKYSDKRHPDEIKFARTIEEDLARRDFTINAVALRLGEVWPPRGSTSQILSSSSIREEVEPHNIGRLNLHNIEIVDPHGGGKDLENKLVRTVGKPKDRFAEDALRLLRAVRLSVELGFEIEKETARAIKAEAGLLEAISKERIRDEFVKMIMAPRAAGGINLLEDLGLLRYIIPELREGIACGQNKHHIYTVFDHNVRALDYAADKNYSLEVRLASLLHDVGKPRTKAGEGPDSTFYNHEIVGARMTAQILDRLRFGKEIVEHVTHFVRYHLFYYNVGEVTEAGVRRFLQRVGPENVPDLMKVREADRIGSGVPKAVPYKLRHLLFMIEKVKKDPIHPKMLVLKGNDVMELLSIPPGPKVGHILSILLEEVLDEPAKNRKENLEFRIRELGKMEESELENLARKARERKDEFEVGIEQEIKNKHHVK